MLHKPIQMPPVRAAGIVTGYVDQRPLNGPNAPAGFSAKARARATARSSTFSGEASSLASPISSARCGGQRFAAEKQNPRFMRPNGIDSHPNHTRRQHHPKFTSFSANRNGPSAITRASQAKASTAPPATECPEIAATTGFGNRNKSSYKSMNEPK